jgi:type II secretory pathway pseudopilin PulG
LADNGLAPKIVSQPNSIVAAREQNPSATGGGAEAEPVSAASIELGRSIMAKADQGLALDIVALEGKPGLAKRPDDALGIPLRPSDKESLQVQPKLQSRIRNPSFGGSPALNPDAVVAKEAFRNRTSSVLVSASQPATEAAIQLGLQFLAKHQNPDGSWSLGNFDRDHPQHAAQLNSDMAATGLALLAFQGAGYNHREFKYATVVRRGIYWLIENQQDNGCLYVEADKKSNQSCRFYSHGIAALALTEAYGMTQDSRLKEPAQRAMNYIVNTQDARRGGWRYYDHPDTRSSDTSVSGWMMMALHSGRLVGLNVESKVFDGIDKWLELAVDPDDPARFRYNPFTVDADGISRIQGRRSTPTMTAVGLLMRIYSGMAQDDPILRNGANWLVKNYLPTDATPESRDTYYWYYATQVLKYLDGPLWEQWDQRLRSLLIQSQIKTGEMAGSWHPYNPIPDRWGAFGGRLYVTTMNLLSLEVQYRMLPLYQKTNVSSR